MLNITDILGPWARVPGMFVPTFSQLPGTGNVIAEGDNAVITVTHRCRTGRIYYQARFWGFSGDNVFPRVPATGIQILQLQGEVNGNDDVLSAIRGEWFPGLLLGTDDPGLGLQTFGVLTVPKGLTVVKLEIVMTDENPGELFTVSSGAIIVSDVIP